MRCSSGVEFAAALRDTRRSSEQGRALSTAPSGRRYGSSRAETCRRFPVKWREKHLIGILLFGIMRIVSRKTTQT